MSFLNAELSQGTAITTIPAADENSRELATADVKMHATNVPNGPTSGQYAVVPKKRIGGRKGRMSHEEKEQRTKAKNLGICIRCRKMRTKV